MNNNTEKIILLSLIPCLVANLLTLAAGVEIFPFPDTMEYLALSRNLQNNFSFVSENTYLCRRVPGYPFLIMPFSFLGDYGFLAVNLLALFGICFFSLKIAEKYQLKNSWLLVVFICFSPGLITLASVPLTEIIFTFFLILSIYLFVNDKFFCSGLALSAASFCRPAGVFLFLLLAVLMLWKRKKIILVLLFVVGANLLPAFWTTRNYLKYGYPVYTTLSNFYLLHYKAGSYLSWKNNVPFNDTRIELNKQLTGKNIFERSASAGKLGRKILLDNFVGFCLWAPQDLIRFWMPDINPLYERLNITAGNRGTLDVLRRQGILNAVKYYFAGAGWGIIIFFLIYCALYGLLLAAMVIGLLRMILDKHYQMLIFGSLLTVYFWLLPLGNLDWRFRMPIMPFLFMLAIYGLNAIKAYWPKYRNPLPQEE